MEQPRPLKRRACEPCRKLKVQCNFDSTEASSCVRCLKSDKGCIVTGRRRRNIVAKSAVTELERKLNALSASLEAIKANPSSSDSVARKDDENSRPQETNPPSGHGACTPEARQRNPEQTTTNSKEAAPSGLNPVQRNLAQPDELFERGILTTEIAAAAFDYFRHSMLPHFPLILLPLDVNIPEFRRNNPILFLSAVNAASGTVSIEIQRGFNHHLLRIFAERILLAGEKSLELIQAVQICCLWHYPPGRYEALKYYQLVSH